MSMTVFQSCGENPKTPPITISTSSDRQSYKSTDPITLTVILKNDSSQYWEITFPPLVRLHRSDGAAAIVVNQVENYILLPPGDQRDLLIHLPSDAPSFELIPGNYVAFIKTNFSNQLGETGQTSNLQGTVPAFVVEP